MTHYTEDELALYDAGTPAGADREIVALHLRQCEACTSALKFVRLIDEALRDDLPWIIADELSGPAVPPTLVAAAHEIDVERAVARSALLPLVETPIRLEKARIELDRAFETAGVVEVLCEIAETLRQQNPQFGLTVASTAVAIAAKLSRAGVSRGAAVLGTAWRERAAALFMLGRFRDAERAAKKAEDAFERDPRSTMHDLALVWLVRANVYVESERIAEAQPLAVAAARQFQEFGDRKRTLTAILLQGNILFMRRQFAEAAEIFEDAIERARAVHDRMLLARALQNCAYSYASADDSARALPYYFDALALWDELGLDVERIRTNWGLASLLLRAGDVDEAIRRLDLVRHEFEALGITNDAALARLELAEALLVAGRAGAVNEVLSNVVVTFSSEGMMKSAQSALAYLREAHGSALSADDVRDVRIYLEQLPARPSAVFTPRR